MTGDLVVQANTNDNPFIYLDMYSDSLQRYGRLYFQKSHNDTVGTMTTTLDGDWIGNIKYMGTNNVGVFTGGAYMSVQQTGAAGAYVPTEMEWVTYTNAAPNLRQFVLNSDGSTTVT
ncbi:unnamed protein product, partial [marine sediment metagenome]